MYELMKVRRSLRIYNRVRDKVKFLPDELIVEILIRLPAQSVGRCKCVCKSWCALIQDPKFVDKHLERSKVVYMYGENTNENGDEEIFEHVDCLDGLLLEQSSLTGKFLLRNPITKQMLNLPDPHGKGENMCLLRVPESNTIMLVDVYCKEGTEHGGCQVLTVGTDLAWRAIDCPSIHNLGEKGKFFTAAICKVFYVIRFFHNVGFRVPEVVYFEVETEHFAVVKIPHALFPSFEHVHPLPWDSKLGLANLVEQELHIWVLEDHKTQKWTERKVVIPSTVFGKYPKTLLTLLPCSFFDDCLWLLRCDNTPVKYDLRKKREYIDDPPPGKRYLYAFYPSLVSWKVNRSQEKLKWKQNKQSGKREGRTSKKKN